MARTLLNCLLFFPSREILATPAQAGLAYEEPAIGTRDGERLHGWWVPAVARPGARARAAPPRQCGQTSATARRTPPCCARPESTSSCRPSGLRPQRRAAQRAGDLVDARAARAALPARPEVDPAHVVYLGESLGGAVALTAPPAGPVLMSTLTSARDMARRHYPIVPPGLVPDRCLHAAAGGPAARPAAGRPRRPRRVVPLLHAEALFEPAPEPKQLHVIEGVGHNDLVALAGAEWATVIARFRAGAR